MKAKHPQTPITDLRRAVQRRRNTAAIAKTALHDRDRALIVALAAGCPLDEIASVMHSAENDSQTPGPDYAIREANHAANRLGLPKGRRGIGRDWAADARTLEAHDQMVNMRLEAAG